MRQHRMINTKIFTDDRFTSLPPRARVLYAELICYADDDGFVGNLRALVSRKSHMQPLIDAGYVHVFDKGPAVVLHWYCHNAVKPSHAKETIYEAEKALLTQDKQGLYRLKTQEELSGNLPSKEKESEVKKNEGKESEEKEIKVNEREENKSEEKEREENLSAAPAEACGASLTDKKKEADFDLFWEKYPKKVGQIEARIIFMGLKDNFDDIMAGLEHHIKCHQWVSDSGFFVPDPAKWLKRRGWEDRPPLHRDKFPQPATPPSKPCGARGELGPEELAAIQRALAEA